MKKITLFVLLAILLAACEPGTVKPTTTPAALGDFPVGNYRNTVLAWTWDFNTDGSYSAGGPQVTEKGNFTVNGNQITFKGDYCGIGTGSYTWTYDGTALKFEAIHDECAERAGTVVSGKWVREP